MTRDPIRRRFGKGAARLRVGLPPDAEPLSAIARTPIRLERRLTIVPFVTAVAIAWLLVTSPAPDAVRPNPDAEPIQIVIEARPVPKAPERILPTPSERALERRRPVPTEALAARRARQPAARPEAQIAPPAEARPFDPSALATRGARWSEAEARAAENASAELIREATTGAVAERANRFTHGDSAGPLPTDVATATRTARAAPIPTTSSIAEMNDAPLAARPSRGTGETGPSDALVATATAGARSRVAALAALDRSVAQASSRSSGAAPTERRPEVSAPLAAAPLLAGTSSGSTLDGWQEVPLDELPDCDPPGRQDLLKKRILLAASVKQECSHASGSYRFVEARSLGAFLMWSRPNPDRRAGQPRDRDACDVLQRALACLGDPSSQESKSR